MSEPEGSSSSIPAKKYKSLSAVLGATTFSVIVDSTSRSSQRYIIVTACNASKLCEFV